MAKPGKCEHGFKVIKSDTTLILWNCNMCHSGPHWFIHECSKCKLKACKPCSEKVRHSIHLTSRHPIANKNRHEPNKDTSTPSFLQAFSAGGCHPSFSAASGPSLLYHLLGLHSTTLALRFSEESGGMGVGEHRKLALGSYFWAGFWAQLHCMLRSYDRE